MSETARALHDARRAARLSTTALGRGLGLHPRTVHRWEVGESRPREHQWPSLLAFLARHDVEAACALAARLGRAMPVERGASEVDASRLSHVVASAADALDVAPKRVREVVRAVARAAEQAGVPFDALVRASLDGAEA